MISWSRKALYKYWSIYQVTTTTDTFIDPWKTDMYLSYRCRNLNFPNVKRRLSVVNHLRTVSSHWLTMTWALFKTSWVGGVVRGGKLTAWFPHIAGEEDYACNPLNSICSNEYVCECMREREGNTSVSNKWKSMYRLICRFN